MFSIVRNETFKQKVTVNVKTDSGWREEHFMGIFKRVDADRTREIAQMPFGQAVDEVLVGWEMVDLQRLPVEFTPENLAAFKTLPDAPRETVLAFLAANSGAKEKN